MKRDFAIVSSNGGGLMVSGEYVKQIGKRSFETDAGTRYDFSSEAMASLCNSQGRHPISKARNSEQLKIIREELTELGYIITPRDNGYFIQSEVEIINPDDLLARTQPIDGILEDSPSSDTALLNEMLGHKLELTPPKKRRPTTRMDLQPIVEKIKGARRGK